MTDEQWHKKIGAERRALRRAQAGRIMPLLGNLLDHWDGLPNDLVSQIEEYSPDFARAMRQLDHAMEQE